MGLTGMSLKISSTHSSLPIPFRQANITVEPHGPHYITLDILHHYALLEP